MSLIPLNLPQIMPFNDVTSLRHLTRKGKSFIHSQAQRAFFFPGATKSKISVYSYFHNAHMNWKNNPCILN